MRIARLIIPRVLATATAITLLTACPSDDPVGIDKDADFTTPATVVRSQGDGQSAIAGQPFIQPLRVTVFTPTGHKCNGCDVQWTLTPGQFVGGSVRTKTVVTGESGLSITSLSPRGTYYVRATVANGSYVEFRLDAM